MCLVVLKIMQFFFFFVKYVWNIFLTGFVRYTQCLLLVSIILNKLTPNCGWLFYKSENGRLSSIIIYNVQILATIRKSGYIRLPHLTKRTSNFRISTHHLWPV